MKTLYIENFVCLVGKNAQENWQLLQDANSNDILFHLTSFPSCYVILKDENLIHFQIIQKCAEICLENTKYKKLKNISVDYTEISNVKKGEERGELIYLHPSRVQRLKI